jgi:hypothetical protein
MILVCGAGFQNPHNSTASAADRAGSAAVLAFLAGAAVGHHLGVIGVDLTRRAGLVIA